MSVLAYSCRQISLFNGLMIGVSMIDLAANRILNTDVKVEEKLIKWPQITYQTTINPELWINVDDVEQWSHINNVFWLDVHQMSKIETFPLQGTLAISLNKVQYRFFKKRQYSNSSSRILIITEDSKTNQQLQILFQTSYAQHSLLCIKGEMNYYQRFIEQQNKMFMNMGTPLQSKMQ